MLYFILISALVNEYNIINTRFCTKGVLYTIDEIISQILLNITTYFILIDKYVILNAVE